jgi:hypothetical protein
VTVAFLCIGPRAVSLSTWAMLIKRVCNVDPPEHATAICDPGE